MFNLAEYWLQVVRDDALGPELHLHVQLVHAAVHQLELEVADPDLDELVTYSDRILVLHAGHVYEIADASATDIDELGHLIGGSFEGTKTLEAGVNHHP
jgi:hypothetical protein